MVRKRTLIFSVQVVSICSGKYGREDESFTSTELGHLKARIRKDSDSDSNTVSRMLAFQSGNNCSDRVLLIRTRCRPGKVPVGVNSNSQDSLYGGG